MDRDSRYWLEQGEATARNPGGWLYTADALKRSADILLAASDEDRRKLVDLFSKGDGPSLADELAEVAGAPFLAPVYLQLAGLAIENLAKGIAVARDPTVVAVDERGRLVTWGHISVRLFEDLGISLNDAEAAQVERLSVFVEWVGRYPVPRFARQLSGSRTFDRDQAAIEALFDRLRSELVAAAPAHQERLERNRQQQGREHSRLCQRCRSTRSRASLFS
jgi:hypothetical protein